MSKINELLGELDTAFEYAKAKNAALAKVQASAASAIADASVKLESAIADAQAKLDAAKDKHQASLDAIKADHQAKIQAATDEANEARTALNKVRDSVNERVGSLTGSGGSGQISGWSSAQ